MLIKSFGHSDVGRRREKNEDSFLFDDELNLYVVADGMGGHVGGDFASQLAVRTMRETIRALEEDPEATLPDSGIAVRPGEYQAYLRYAIRLSSERIYEKANGDPALHGMGTTTVALLLRDGKAYVANVGDSRVYRIRGSKIEQITKDHSLVGEQIRAGILTEDDARGHRLKNIITRSVGFQEEVDVDIDIRVVRDGDRFLLCSDGLSNMLEDSEIGDIVSTNNPENGCRRLIDVANERGGDDNITVVIVEAAKLNGESGASGEDDTTMEV